MAIRVTVWNEYLHEVQFPEVAEVYPKGIHGCIADFLKEAGMDVKTATLREPEHGLTQEVVDNTDVLIWWGHMAHQEVSDEIVDRVYNRVLEGMGLIVLHSGHASKIFRKMCSRRRRHRSGRRLQIPSCTAAWRAKQRLFFSFETVLSFAAFRRGNRSGVCLGEQYYRSTKGRALSTNCQFSARFFF